MLLCFLVVVVFEVVVVVGEQGNNMYMNMYMYGCFGWCAGKLVWSFKFSKFAVYLKNIFLKNQNAMGEAAQEIFSISHDG